MRVFAVLILSALMVFPAVASQQEAAAHPEIVEEKSLPAGLESFLEARSHELAGDYSEALKLYESAAVEAPEVEEIRVLEASLMLDLGMAGDAWMLLKDAENLDWYGLRIRALALTQLAGTDPERLPEARKALEELLQERPDDPNIEFALIKILEVAGDLDEAVHRLRDLRKGMGGNQRLASLEGEMLSKMGRNAEALQVYEECEAIDESCRRGVIQSLLALGKMGEAGEKLLDGLEADDLDRMMQAAALLADGGRSARALEVVERVLRADPKAPEARRFKAILLVRLGRIAEAAPLLDDLVRKNPDDVDLRLARAGVLAALQPGHPEKARKDLERAWSEVSADAGSKEAVDVALEAARIELDAGHISAARDWLQRVGDVRAGGGRYLYLLAESYRQAEQYRDGVGALIRAETSIDESLRPLAAALEAELGYRGGMTGALSRLDPLLENDDRDTALLALSVIQSLELWPRLEEESRKLLERFPGDRELMFSLATALERQGRFDESVEVFEKLLKAHPDDAGAANYLGYMLADADRDLDHALELIEQAIKAEPENGAYLDSMGWVLYRMGRTAQAEIWLEKALSRSGPQAADILAHLGEVRLKLGRREEGLVLLRRALDLGCEHPERIRELIDSSAAEGAGEPD